MSTQSCDFLGNSRERGWGGENVWEVNDYICSGVAGAEWGVEGSHVKLAKPALLGVSLGTVTWMFMGYAVEGGRCREGSGYEGCGRGFRRL